MKVKDNKGEGEKKNIKEFKLLIANPSKRREAWKSSSGQSSPKELRISFHSRYNFIRYSGIDFIKESSKSETSLSITPREPFN